MSYSCANSTPSAPQLVMEPFIGQIMLFAGTTAKAPTVSEVTLTKVADNSATGL